VVWSPGVTLIGVKVKTVAIDIVRRAGHFGLLALRAFLAPGTAPCSFYMSRLISILIINVTLRMAADAQFDLIIRNGTIYDGSGGAPISGDVAVLKDRIAAVGQIKDPRAKTEIDAHGLAVAPGFINMLSWANESLIADGRSQSDIRQGVTLEVLGEGESMGPLNANMRANMESQQGDIRYAVKWRTLAEYLDHLVRLGISPNVASFVGATTVRIHEIGYADRPPDKAELARMCELVREAMKEGALGLSSSLIYAPAFYAKTDELIALAKVAAQFDGIYISHVRSESSRLLEAVDEFLTIAREAKIRAEIYHLKAAGQRNWSKLEALLQKIEASRASGAHITADMYTYTAASTGLDASMPPWVQEGGYDRWAQRLRDPEVRARVKREMSSPADNWENLYYSAGSPSNILLVGFKNPKLKPLTGMTLAEVAKQRTINPEETAMDLVIEDGTRVSTVYHLMSEENVRKEIKQPWMSFGSDAGSMAPEGVFLQSSTHPRAYGNFARLLGKYVRDEKIISLPEAIRRLTSLPASNLKLKQRGLLKPGMFADVVVFDPAKIADHATFNAPQQYASGVVHVFVNGVQVLKEGEHTGAKPGRVVRRGE
jgi:N-acyl-D-amino-acid deacylase